MNNIFEIAFDLQSKLKESPEYIKLKQCENIINNDHISKSLVDNYKKLHEDYTFDHSTQLQVKLHEAKLEMDQNINVINYKKAYKEYMLLVGNITDIVFENYKNDNVLDKIIRACK